MATLDPGDADCTTGIAKRIFDQVLADARNGFSDPLSSAQTDAIKALCYAEAKGVADEINAAGGVGGGGGGTVPGIYWAPPAVAHPADEEFDGDLSAWTLGSGLTLAGVVDPTLSFTAASTIRADCGVRPSWVRIQPAKTGSQYFAYTKTISPLPTNFVAWARIAAAWDGYSGGSANADVGLFLSDSGGTDFAATYLCHASAGALGRLNHGGLNQQTNLLPKSDHPAFDWSLVAIRRVGQDFTFWVGTDEGDWRPIVHLVASAGTMINLDTVKLLVGNAAGASAGLGNSVLCFDFVRFLETSEWPL